jgi:antitoxin MazE
MDDTLVGSGGAMRFRVQKWGHSLAIRIPKALARQIGLSRDSDVEVSVCDGRLVVSPVDRQTPRLEDLVSRISKRNRHPEISFGPSRGKEIW